MPEAGLAATHAFLDRLRRRHAPILLGPSPLDELARAAEAPPAEIVPRAIRHAPERIVALQRAVLDAGADAIVAPTARTSAAWLRTTGFAYRAAALTGLAIDLSREAALGAPRAAAIIGELDPMGGDERASSEARTHVERLAVAGVDAVIVLADTAARAVQLVELAGAHGLATLVELPAEAATEVPADVACVVVRSADPRAVAAAIGRLRRDGLRLGARLMTSQDARAAALAAERAHELWWTLGLDLIGAVGAAALAAQRAFAARARRA